MTSGSILGDTTIRHYLDQLRSDAPAPGGGSAACLAGALAGSLAEMVLAIHDHRALTTDSPGLRTQCAQIRSAFLTLAEEDAAAFERVMAIFRSDKSDPERATRIQAALVAAAEVPLRGAETAVSLLRLLPDLVPLCSKSIVSDVAVSAHLAAAACRACSLNVRVNTISMEPTDKTHAMEAGRKALEREMEPLYAATLREVDRRMEEG